MKTILLHDSVSRLRNRVRKSILIFMGGLVISGLTAFPLETELRWMASQVAAAGWTNAWSHWILKVNAAIASTNRLYPFMAYGTDWLAFAHLVIAIVFIGPLRDPVRNKWVIEFGLIACFAIFPLAFIAGAVREIPVFWRLIDCSFGVAGGALLFHCLTGINQLEEMESR